MPTSNYPNRLKARVIGPGRRPQRSRRYDLHLVEVGEAVIVEVDDEADFANAAASARVAISRYTRSPAGAGRKFAGRREVNRMVFTRVA